MNTLILRSLAAVLFSLSCTHAYASQETLDIDTKFRAKIAKEKVKQGFQQRSAQNSARDSNQAADPSCGSQSIGNIDTNGRIGTAPREVFVFAPNAVNVVTAGGCR